MLEPKYTACIQYEECISYYGQGGTPEDAFIDFMAEGFDDEVGNMEPQPDDVEVRIYTTVWPNEDGEFPEEYGDEFAWYLGDLVEKRKVDVKRGNT